MDELEIINAMLAVVGEHPVSSKSSLHPTVVIAKSILSIANKKMQGKGWFFNTEYGVVLKPAADGRIVVPSNILKFRIEGSNIIQRGGVLYDMDQHTDKFSGDVTSTLTLDIDIDSLPPNAQAYLCAMACANMFLNDDGEGGKMDRLDREVENTFRVLRAEHIIFVNQNQSNSPRSQAVLKGA